MSAKVDYLNVSGSPIVRVLNYLAVTAPSDELFESLLLDMQNLGVAVPQATIYFARNKFNAANINSNSLDAAAVEDGYNVNISIGGRSSRGRESGVLQPSVDNDEVSSAGEDDDDINRIEINYQGEVCQEADDTTVSSAPARKRKQPSERGQCSIEGCTNMVVRRGLCYRHGTNNICRHEGCTNIIIQGGVCVRHGAKRKPKQRCGSEGCTNKAVNGGVCQRHGAKVTPRKLCTYEGCTNQVKVGGLCIRHGAKVKRCSKEGCTKHVQIRGFCSEHSK